MVVVATGGKPATSGEYLYGQDPRVLTQRELEQQIAEGTLATVQTVVMIQCVGSREPERPYCSRVCCTQAVKNALKLKELRPELEDGLRDIEGFSHLFVLWVFHRSEGFDLVAHVPLDDRRPHGVFSSRSPRRPNPIGLSVLELLGREGPVLRVRGLDMLDGTPILDIKPYLSSIPSEKLRRGWVEEAEARKRR